MKKGDVGVLFASFAVVLTGLLGVNACIRDTQDAKNAVIITDAVCKQLDTQNSPEWVEFACDRVNDAGKILDVFTMKVPKKMMVALQPCKPEEK